MQYKLFFFNRGLTIAVLSSLGKHLVCNDKFTMIVTRGRSSSKQFLNIHIGIGSNKQVLLAIDLMI